MNVNQKWTPPKQYKKTDEAIDDYKKAMSHFSVAVDMMAKIGRKLNETEPGHGDVLIGVSTEAALLADKIKQADPYIVQSIKTGTHKSSKTRRLVRTASRKAESRDDRKQIRQRRKSK